MDTKCAQVAWEPRQSPVVSIPQGTEGLEEEQRDLAQSPERGEW